MTDEPLRERLPYRPNVGAVLFNRGGQVFVARRADLPNAEGAAGGWQLPQGGIDAGEDPAAAVLRELAEEIGTDRAEIIGEHPDWLTYDLPAELLGAALQRPLPRPAAALVRAALPRHRRRHPAGCRPASRVRRLALGGAGRAAGAGGGVQAADLPECSLALVRPLRRPLPRGLNAPRPRRSLRPACCRLACRAPRPASARWTPPSA